MAQPPAPNEPPKGDEHALLTLPGWIEVYRRGTAPGALLLPRLERIAPSAVPGVWIRLTSTLELTARRAERDALAARHGAREQLLAAFPLFGMPFAVKDGIDLEGWATTAGRATFAWTADRSATVVRRLLDGGAVLLGKTNLGRFATGLVGTRTRYGAPASVFAPQRVSGGSVVEDTERYLDAAADALGLPRTGAPPRRAASRRAGASSPPMSR